MFFVSALRYLLFNKPFNVLTQFTRSSASPGSGTLADYISIPNIYPAGRLDRDSEGLLLLTDDGRVQHRLAGPRYRHPKTYWTQVEGAITPQAIASLSAGVVIKGLKTLPATVNIMEEPTLWRRDPPIRFRQNIPASWMELTIVEGRNRQVRHMTAAVGLPTLRLIRVALGPLQLNGLAPGAYKELTRAEIAQLHTILMKDQ